MTVLATWLGTCGWTQAQTYVNRVGPNAAIRDVTLDSAQWTLASGPYVIEAQVTVKVGATLKMNQGTVVKMNPGCGISVDGTLQATGVNFSRNGNAAWRGFYFTPTSNGSILSGCTLQGAGANIGYIDWADRFATMYLSRCPITIDNCRIQDTAGHGIELSSSNATIKNTSIQNVGDGSYAVALNAVDVLPSLADNSASGTGVAGVSLPGNWDFGDKLVLNRPGANLPYFVNGELRVPQGRTVTVDPGVVFKTDGQRILVYGTLLANGTEAQRVVFTSRKTAPAPGDWKGIYLGPQAGSSILSYATIEYAGQSTLGYIHWADRNVALLSDYSNAKLDHVTITKSQNQGLWLFGSTNVITGCEFSQCGGNAIVAEENSRPTISQTRFVANGSLAGGSPTIAMDVTCVPTPSGLTFQDNIISAVNIWGGTLASSADWKNWAANAPYLISGDVTVSEPATLTIEAGATVKFKKARLWMEGTLKAVGASAPITFTSWRDDTVGGNTDAANDAPAIGDWKGIYLGPKSGASVLEKSQFRFSGQNLGYINWADRFCFVYVNQSAPRITGCTFAKNGGHGLVLNSSTAEIRDNVFTDMAAGSYAIALDSLDRFPKTSGNQSSGTGFPGLAVPGGGLGDGIVWDKPGLQFFYFMNGELSLPANATNILSPGVVVKSAGQKMNISGALLVQGTETEPVLFTSRNDAPKPGDWRGLYFDPSASKSVLSYLTIEYGGDNLGYINWGDRFTSLYLNQCSPRFDHLTIRNSLWHGLWLFGSSSIVRDYVVNDCAGHGLIAEEGSRPLIANALFKNNGKGGEGYYAVAMAGESVPDPVNTRFEGNRFQGVQVAGETLATNGLWKRWATNAPYVITADVTIAPNVTLAIEPGAVVKLKRSGLYCNGVIKAIGEISPITFTSYRDDTVAGSSNDTNSVPAVADWKGIYLSSASSASEFANCVVRYPGSNLGYINWSDRFTAFYVNGSSPSFRKCVIGPSSGQGIVVYSSSGIVTDTVFEAVGKDNYAIAFDTVDTFPTLSGNAASGEGNLGIYVPAGGVGDGTRWTNPGKNFAYFLGSELAVPEGRTFTVDPGVVVKSAGQRLVVDGTLRAIGTAADPIVFTSRNKTPTRADWKGIYFGPRASGSVVAQARLSFTGANQGYINWADRYTAIYVNQSSPQFHNIIVSHNGGQGLELFTSSALVQGSLIYSNAANGILLTEGGSPQLINNTIVFNEDNGLHCPKSSPKVANNIIAFNRNTGFRLDAGTPSLNNNCIFSNAKGDYFNFNKPATDFSVDPQFVDPANFNFHLKVGSGCIARGDATALLPAWTELDGQPRIAGTAVDVGAYRFGSQTPQHDIDLAIRNSGDAGYTGEGVYSPSSQTRSQTKLAGEIATYVIKVTNRGNLPDDIQLTANALSGGWRARFFDAATGGKDITEPITASVGYVVTSLAPAAAIEMRLELTGDKTIAANGSASVSVRGSSKLAPTRIDLATAVLTIPPASAVTTAGGLDSEFDPGTGPDDDVLGMATQNDGKILIVGRFTKFNGVSRNGIARLNANGSLDPTFNPGLGFSAGSNVWSVAIQPDGKIMAAGEFIHAAGTPQTAIARLQADGTRDASFSPLFTASRGTAEGYWLNLRPDGKILIAGWFSGVSGVSRNCVARLNADGSLDQSFDPGSGANDSVSEIQVQSDGGILIGGWFTEVNGVSRTHLARLNTNGSLDSTFKPGIAFVADQTFVYSLALQADGRVLAGGWFKSVSGSARNHLARFNFDGSLDTSLNSNAATDDTVRSLVLEKSGKIWIGGSFTRANGIARGHVARLNSDGSLDATFDPGSGANDWIRQVAFYGTDNVLIGGDFTTYNGTPRNRIARILTTTPATGSECQTPPSGLIGWWSGDGAANDLQGTRNGTLKNGAAIAAGLVGQAFSLDGVDDYVDLGLWNAGTQWTIEAWVNPSSTPSGRRTIAGALNEYRDWAITMHDGQFGVAIRTPGGGADTIRTGVAATAGTWFHVVATCDGATAKIYLNGELKNSAAVDPNYVGTPTGTWIGGENCCGGANFPGLVDEVSIYSRALPASEIQSVFVAGSSGKCKPTNVEPGEIVKWSGNGHSYQVVLVGASGISWAEARTAAERAGGHLATISSEAENTFVFGLVKGTPDFWYLGGSSGIGPWLGGYQPSGSTEPNGGWTWVTGEPMSYTNWSSGEPNNNAGAENSLHFYGAGQLTGSAWNDVGDTSPVRGYIMEFETPVITSALTASGQVGVAFTYQILASNIPTSYAAAGLPADLSVNSASGLISGTPTLAGTSTVTLSAANAGGTGTTTLTLTVSVSTGGANTFSAWVVAHQLPAGADGPAATPSGDGVANLLKFAMGLDPKVASPTSLVAAAMDTRSGQKYAGIAFSHAKNVTGIHLILESSSDLQTWREVSATMEKVSDLDATREWVRFLNNAPVGAESARFYRLKVTLNSGALVESGPISIRPAAGFSGTSTDGSPVTFTATVTVTGNMKPRVDWWYEIISSNRAGLRPDLTIDWNADPDGKGS